jgi:hypothetical protein
MILAVVSTAATLVTVCQAAMTMGLATWLSSQT